MTDAKGAGLPNQAWQGQTPAMQAERIGTLCN